jgi:hypothetical protein
MFPTGAITASHQLLSHLFNDALLSHIGTFWFLENRGSFIAPLTSFFTQCKHRMSLNDSTCLNLSMGF